MAVGVEVGFGRDAEIRRKAELGFKRVRGTNAFWALPSIHVHVYRRMS